MMSLNALADGFAAALTTDQTDGSFFDDLGGRIYELELQSNNLPACRWTVITNPPIHSLGSRYVQAEIQCDLYAAKDDGTAAIAQIQDKMTALLDRQPLTISGHTGSQALAIDIGSVAVEDADTFSITSRWRVFALKSGD